MLLNIVATCFFLLSADLYGVTDMCFIFCKATNKKFIDKAFLNNDKG